MKNTQINVLVGLTIVFFVIVLLIQGHSIGLQNSWSAFSYVVTGVSFTLLIWERLLWRWKIFHPWLTARPNLIGTWRGELHSSWVDPIKKEGRGAIEVYLVIRQTYSTINVRLFSAQSGSVSLSASIVTDGEGMSTLAVVYRNTPSVLLRVGSPINHGGMLLYVRGTPVHQLDGEYWTDRDTKGEVKFVARCKALSHDFEQARSLDYINHGERSRTA